MKNKVVMVGYAYSKKDVIIDNSEYWIMNDMYDVFPDFDRLFEMHTIEDIKARKTRKIGLNHYEELKKIDKPVYMQNKFMEIPNSVKYPLGLITKLHHIPAMGDVPFLTCSVSYMLALAITENFRSIALFGIDEAIDDEYKVEMPSVLYWLGVAVGRGIKVEISDHSPLLKGYFLYGYQEPKRKQMNYFLEKEVERINTIKNTAIKNKEFYIAEENKCIGATSMLDHIKKLMNEI